MQQPVLLYSLPPPPSRIPTLYIFYNNCIINTLDLSTTELDSSVFSHTPSAVQLAALEYMQRRAHALQRFATYNEKRKQQQAIVCTETTPEFVLTKSQQTI